ncbi:MAG: hypothetical protein C4B58_05980 [Deltaproteobacteria bacterium]|nr:MAG: hypothetical protein C4B58_05980 [Deltaproteobacteria bacterium]
MKDIVMILSAVGLGAFGQLSLKKGMLLSGPTNIGIDVIKATFTPYVSFGLVLYATAMILWLAVLSRVELSFAYPMLSLGYVFVIFASWLIFNEHVSTLRIAGILFICIGVAMMGRS